MLDALMSIIEAIQSAIQFLINTVTSLASFIAQIPTNLAFLTTALNLIPSVIIPFGLAGITTYIVLLLIDRR